MTSAERVVKLVEAEERLARIIELTGLHGKHRYQRGAHGEVEILKDQRGIGVNSGVPSEREEAIDAALLAWSEAVKKRLWVVEDYVAKQVGTVGEAA
jgi:hypothetical protein